jgi:hypothetical protein
MTETAAEKAAEAMVAKIKYPNFKPRVWENQGWHYTAGNGFITLHPYDYDEANPGYWACPSPCYAHYNCPVKKFSDPNDAIDFAINAVTNFIIEQNGRYFAMINKLHNEKKTTRNSNPR